jgi:translation initiation factor IF-1
MSKTKDDILEAEGMVTEVLPNSTFKVKLDGIENPILCYTGGKLKQHKIKIILGDRVRTELSVYDLTKGRITFRL